MLVTFSSKVDADILMMAQDAKQVLKAAGKEIGDTVPDRGVFSPEQLEGAIQHLETAIANEAPAAEPADDDHEKPRVVKLGQRAFPLLSMMRKAKLAHASVLWETSSGY